MKYVHCLPSAPQSFTFKLFLKVGIIEMLLFCGTLLGDLWKPAEVSEKKPYHFCLFLKRSVNKIIYEISVQVYTCIGNTVQ